MNIIYSRKAAKILNNLDAQTRQRIGKGIERIPEGDIRRIEGCAVTTYRLRVGGWRVLFSYVDEKTVSVEKIAPRGDVYKGVS